MSKKELRELTASCGWLNRSANKATNKKLLNTNGYNSMRICCPEALTPVKRKWICFCVVAACHLEPGCACSTETSAYGRMTNGGSGTDGSEK